MLFDALMLVMFDAMATFVELVSLVPSVTALLVTFDVMVVTFVELVSLVPSVTVLLVTFDVMATSVVLLVFVKFVRSVPFMALNVRSRSNSEQLQWS